MLSTQPGRPMMVMEYWTGWFRHWNEPRPERSLSPQEAADGLKTILSMKSSVNLYMFHGMEFVVLKIYLGCSMDMSNVVVWIYLVL